MMGEGADQWLDAPARRRRTSALLVSLRELSVLMSRAIEASVGDAASSNGAVLVLAHLAEAGPLRSGTLGRLGHLTRGGVSNMLRRFEEDGLVTRDAGPDDGRAVWVALTPAGRRVERELCDAVASALATSQPVVTGAVVTLVELGASAPPPASQVQDRGRRITVALAELDATIAPVLSRPGSVGGAMALASLDVDGPVRVGRLAELLGVTSGGATRLVDQLVEAGLVRRVHDASGDARGVEVSLTSKGERILGEVTDDLGPLLGDLLVAMRSAMLDLGDPD